MPVVGHVAQRIHAIAAAADGQEGAVGIGGGEVGEGGVVVAPEPDVGMRRHVHQVAGTGGERGQRIRVRLGTAGVRGGFGGVDVVMQRADVARVAREHAFQLGQDARCARGLLAFRGPVRPRGQVHQRLGMQRGDVVVIRETGGGLAHRIGIGLVQCGTVGRRGVGIAQRQRIDQGAVGRGCARGQTGRARRQRRRLGGAGRVHRQVDVGAQHQGLAPDADRAVGIAPRRFRERAPGGLVVEAVGQPQALVEILLRRRNPGADVAVRLAQAWQQRDVRGALRGFGRRGA